jgi:hypothetical protein
MSNPTSAKGPDSCAFTPCNHFLRTRANNSIEQEFKAKTESSLASVGSCSFNPSHVTEPEQRHR